VATSGTTSFNMLNASIATAAYSRIGIRRSAIIAEHMADAYTESNLMLSKFSNLPVNLWTVELVQVPLIAGTATYSVDPSTLNILDAYISFNSDPISNRLIFPISRTDYASYSNPSAQGTPSVFWYDKLINPTITLWLVPDQTSTYTLNYYRTRQIQDTNLIGGQTPEVPYRWLDCMVAELSHRLARIWKPELEAARKIDAKEAWDIAAAEDVEDVGLMIAPQVGTYYNQ
jgi:hypothetical protein